MAGQCELWLMGKRNECSEGELATWALLGFGPPHDDPDRPWEMCPLDNQRPGQIDRVLLALALRAGAAVGIIGDDSNNPELLKLAGIRPWPTKE